MRKKTNKRQIAYDVIRSRIVDGVYVPGQRIIIDQIAKEVGSSHIPVREAIHQLESEQFIEYKPNVGAIIRGINDDLYKETLHVLALLEGYATALSCNYMTHDGIEKLKEYNQEMKESLTSFDLEKIGQLNRQFHNYIYSFCPNKLLLSNIQQLLERLDTVRKSEFTFYPKRTPKSIQEHDQLIELLSEGKDLQKIEATARQHKLNTLQAFIDQE
ncbi:GntR family transcriptional regulator [Metabacillus rhizolycopersici]|uniref:GntR family transcriptional regulator n=1 Tax=Metabacillus rhizolycopersici TaxID=2875709 RepID=A0ABS7UX56_9BACI|nr:GntR family transcriptional regulator [Metabacillus rhizolycopersici]MBZ5752903.1 GntR family transcriptional regulator [Metabacillus rhizolycopersici]